MKKISFLVLSLLCCIGIFTASPIMALESTYTREQVLEIAFNGNVPNNENLSLEDLEQYEVVYDSRYDPVENVVLNPKAIPSNYDYYRTYYTGVTCKGSGAASSSILDVNINFYINVFFKIDSNYKSSCIGYENPVITGLNNHYGATGYSNPKVVVTSWSSSKINFKGTCTLTAGMTFTMSGTSSITVLWWSYMSKKIRFIDPKRTKELQESMKDHGRASTYWGLIILIFFIIAFILSYYFQIR